MNHGWRVILMHKDIYLFEISRIYLVNTGTWGMSTRTIKLVLFSLRDWIQFYKYIWTVLVFKPTLIVRKHTVTSHELTYTLKPMLHSCSSWHEPLRLRNSLFELNNSTSHNIQCRWWFLWCQWWRIRIARKSLNFKTGRYCNWNFNYKKFHLRVKLVNFILILGVPHTYSKTMISRPPQGLQKEQNENFRWSVYQWI